MTTDWSWIHTIDTIDVADVHGAVSEQDVLAAEAAIGAFPPEYRSFVLAVGTCALYHREYFGVHPGVELAVDVVGITLSERTEMERLLPAHLIAVYNDGGGNLYCVKVDVGDERDPHRNAVYAWWHDDDSEPELMDESFAHWVRSAYEETRDREASN
jgi:hypothetical protein